MYLLSNHYSVNQATTHTPLNSVVSPLYWQTNRAMTCIETFETNYANCKTNMEDQLSTFISWVLRVTVTGEYSGDAAMELLDQAWLAQKLVWRLRESQSL